jgi:putative transcriptional regulator
MRDWLKSIREGKEMSQQVVADECGISRQYYNLIEKGERTPSVTTAKKIATVLDFDWQLFYEDEA